MADRGTPPAGKRIRAGSRLGGVTEVALVFPVQGQITSPTRRNERERRRGAVERVVVEFVGDVDHVQLRREMLAELVFRQQIKAPMRGNAIEPVDRRAG